MVSEWFLQDYQRQVVLVLWADPSCVTAGEKKKKKTSGVLP